MRKFLVIAHTLLFFMMILSGCNTVGDKSGSLSIIYGAVASISLLLLAGCIVLVRKNRFWFVTLFSSVLVVNVGYTFLSVSASLKTALWANRISYLGSVFLPLSMLMIILNITNTSYKKRVPILLFDVAVLVFLVAASPGILPIYYKDVSFAIVDGTAMLVKVYGPLHPLYLVYLLGYFSAMLAIIIRAKIKKSINTTSHAIIIAIAVFVNIGVWLIEQLVSIDFEMLSVSYIISELFLLGVHLVMKEYQKMTKIIKQIDSTRELSEGKTVLSDAMLEMPVERDAVSAERIEIFMIGLKTLTRTEKAIYDAYIARATTKEIMASMNIKESTLKYHNRNLYGKLGVSTRKELLEMHKHIRSVRARLKQADEMIIKR